MKKKYIVSAYYTDDLDVVYLLTSNITAAKEYARKKYGENPNVIITPVETTLQDTFFGTDGKIFSIADIGELSEDLVNF